MNEEYAQSAVSIGKKLRTARLAQDLSLRELAERAEVSASLLSKIENGKATPSVRSLHSIAEALSLPVNHFFPDKKPGEGDPNFRPLTGQLSEDTATSRQEHYSLETGDATAPVSETELEFEGFDHQPPGPVVRRGARPTIELEGHITWQRLTSKAESGIEFLQTCYATNAKSGEKMSHHSGREFHYVLEGELLLELGFERYLLKAGDSIIFASTTPHRLSNAGSVPMHALSVIFEE
jgi:transcriptional regulator with XRE-family HTH domain